MTGLAGNPRAAGLVGVPVGGGQFDFVESIHPTLVSTASTLGATSSYLSSVRVFRSLTITQMSVGIGAAAGNIDLGIFTSDGTNLVKQASTGATAASGSNAVQTVALTAQYVMRPGVDYWLAVWLSTATTLSVYRTANVQPALNVFKQRSVFVNSGGSALPASIVISGLAGTSAIWLVAW